MGTSSALSLLFGGTDITKPALAKIDQGHMDDPQYRGSWVRGNQFPETHPGYCRRLWEPLVKVWVARPGSEYSQDSGHERLIPAHQGARNEYVYCLKGQLNWVNTSLRKDGLSFGNGPIVLNPWKQGAWILPQREKMALGVTLAFAEPTPSVRVGHGSSHEFHLLGLPDQDPLERLAGPDHLEKNQTDMLLMGFDGSLLLETTEKPTDGKRGWKFSLGSVLYHPSEYEYPPRPKFTEISSDFRGGVLFYIRPHPLSP